MFVEDFECVTGGPVKQEILGVFSPQKTCESFSMHLFGRVWMNLVVPNFSTHAACIFAGPRRIMKP